MFDLFERDTAGQPLAGQDGVGGREGAFGRRRARRAVGGWRRQTRRRASVSAPDWIALIRPVLVGDLDQAPAEGLGLKSAQSADAGLFHLLQVMANRLGPLLEVFGQFELADLEHSLIAAGQQAEMR